MTTTPSSRWTDQITATLRPLGLAIAVALVVPSVSQAAPSPSPAMEPAAVSFNASFVGSMAGDLGRFERGQALPAGAYEADVFVNRTRIGRFTVNLRVMDGDRNATPCLTSALLTTLGVRLPGADARGNVLVSPVAGVGEGCLDLPSLMESASATFVPDKLELQLSIPQVALVATPRGYVDPSLWDNGETAATVAYSTNVYRRTGGPGRDTLQGYLRLSSGLSLGSWRLHHDASYSWSQRGQNHLGSIAGYAQRDVISWRSQLLLGRSNTSGELYESIGFDGVQLASDDRMLPDSQIGYAPVVRGIARSNAKVEVRQSGYVVYQASVAPGAFEIDDLHATGFAGDFEVTVFETDGSINRFTVPFSFVPRLLRPGLYRYSATAGQTQDYGGGRHLRFAEGTYQRGISNAVTLFGGAQVAERSSYMSALTGAAINTSVGAFSVDLTHSILRPQAPVHTRSGRSIRATYSKSLATSGTSVAVAAYRFSSSGFYTLRDAATVLAGPSWATGHDGATQVLQQRRNTLQLTVSQTLPCQAGSLFFSGSSNDYWARSGRETNYQLGYSGTVRRASYAIAGGRSQDAFGRTDHQINLSVSIPLGDAGRSGTQLSLSRYQGTDHDDWRAGINGAVGDTGRLAYNASVAKGSQDGHDYTAGASYRGPWAQLNGSHSHTSRSDQTSAAMSGGLVLHAGGVTLAPSLSGTIGIVDAKDAAGATLTSSSAVVDHRGYAIVNNLRPYRMNSVSVDTGTAQDMIEFDSSVQRTVPRAGAVVRLTYQVTGTKNRLIRLDHTGEGAAFFGAPVTDTSGALRGTVGQGNVVLVHSLAEGEVLNVQTSDAALRCQVVVPALDASPSTGDVMALPCIASTTTAQR
ncbi:fimbrial biogenesis outer membrane usher protein [Stenotrophomonas sp. Sa5BUN4]|uniref:Fimbrial biogenesis outer membrane usher protein n=1 Tax=Stenotrophomonas lacuserhaii TaxID=2760084 RepID=A0A8X8FWR6_9GAMM|nr:fimbria/pilus outer membrane usher protein [Stenotrophomonas pennii]MBD7954312.1 fimbrial biogenesis outer membrane usher protein [Stenotrophomonas pennii]